MIYKINDSLSYFHISVISHTVNLLINMPRDCYEELLAPMSEGDIGIENKEIEYDGKNMEAVIVLLNFLYERLDRVNSVTFFLILIIQLKKCISNNVLVRFLI